MTEWGFAGRFESTKEDSALQQPCFVAECGFAKPGSAVAESDKPSPIARNDANTNLPNAVIVDEQRTSGGQPDKKGEEAMDKQPVGGVVRDPAVSKTMNDVLCSAMGKLPDCVIDSDTPVGTTLPELDRRLPSSTIDPLDWKEKPHTRFPAYDLHLAD